VIITNHFCLQVKNELPCLSNVMLIGDRRKFLSCLVTLKVEVRLSWFNFGELDCRSDVYNEEWLAMLLARLLTTAALLVQIQTSLHNHKWATKAMEYGR
jgi:hypothetical protein